MSINSIVDNIVSTKSLKYINYHLFFLEEKQNGTLHDSLKDIYENHKDNMIHVYRYIHDNRMNMPFMQSVGGEVLQVLSTLICNEIKINNTIDTSSEAYRSIPTYMHSFLSCMKPEGKKCSACERARQNAANNTSNTIARQHPIPLIDRINVLEQKISELSNKIMEKFPE